MITWFRDLFSTPGPVYCSRCGHGNQPGANYCANCGATLSP